jgi:hypothetical protein
MCCDEPLRSAARKTIVELSSAALITLVQQSVPGNETKKNLSLAAKLLFPIFVSKRPQRKLYAFWGLRKILYVLNGPVVFQT